jgi:hypothetical protein
MCRYVLPHSTHSKASIDDEEAPSTFPLHPTNNYDDDEEVPSSSCLQHPSDTLEFNGEDEGDESYTAEDALPV